jgi:hypothetical protein
MNKREVLAATTFGQRIAELEADALISYFVETEQWRKVISGDVDVVYGPKGSGKSALYALLRKNKDELLKRAVVLAAGENVRGAPVFADLVADPPASEEQFRGLWKLYFLSLTGTALRLSNITNEPARELVSILEKEGLIGLDWSLRSMLKGALDYARRIDSVAGGLKLNSATGLPDGVECKITLREPGIESRKLGFISADSLLQIADQAFSALGANFWIILDRLDVAFAESETLESNALRALFRVYSDMQGLNNIRLKIFLRDDVWKRIASTGFREASHITKSITITWDERSLLHLVIRRALHNEAIRSFYKVDPPVVLSSAAEQEKLFYRIFPLQVDSGERKSTTLDWLLTRTRDGTGNTAPRELIHLLSEARDQQLESLERGDNEPDGENLFDRNALKAALPEVSKVRFQQTLCAEHPRLKPFLDKLEREKTQQTAASLAKIWAVSEADALTKAERLTEVGFFQKRGSKEQPQFWVPFLYRDALNLVQGQAEQ